MKKIFLFLLAGSFLFAFTACEQGGGDTGSITVNPSTLNFEASGNSAQYIMVTATNTTWTAAVSSAASSWLNIASSGNSITVTVNDYTGNDPRSGSITVTPVSGDPKIITVNQAGVPAVEIITFTYGETEYYGDYYTNGCGNFDLYFEALDGNKSGYVLFMESFSDLDDANPVFTPHLYNINDNRTIYTIMPGRYDPDRGYVSATLSVIAGGAATNRNSVISGTVNVTGTPGAYVFDMNITLDDGRTLKMAYTGALPAAAPAMSPAAAGVNFKSGLMKAE